MNDYGGIYRFGDYELCPQTRELLHNGKRVEIQDQIFCLLSYLVANNDRAITKEELIEEIWEGKPVSETVIPRAIMKARRAIDDDGDPPKSIRTIRGYGYRFTEPTEIIPCETSQAPATAIRDTDASGDTVYHSSAAPAVYGRTRPTARERLMKCLFMLGILTAGILIGAYIGSSL